MAKHRAGRKPKHPKRRKTSSKKRAGKRKTKRKLTSQKRRQGRMRSARARQAKGRARMKEEIRKYGSFKAAEQHFRDFYCRPDYRGLVPDGCPGEKPWMKELIEEQKRQGPGVILERA